MKRFRLIALGLVVCLLFCSIGTAAEKKFSLVIREGFGSMGIGDLNSVLNSTNNDSVYESLRENSPGLCVGEIREVPNRFKDWEAELRWTPGRFGIGVAVAGPTKYFGKSSLNYTVAASDSMATASSRYESRISVYTPVKLGLYYSLPTVSGVHLVLNAGAGYYHAKMFYGVFQQYLYPSNLSILSYKNDVKGRHVGFHCGFALEYKLNGRFSIIAESQWKFAKIEKLTGHFSATYQEYDADGNLVDSDEATSGLSIMYHYIGADYITGTRHEKLTMMDANASPPFSSLDDGTDFRKAFLDLSGFTFKIGLKIGLF